MDSLLRTSALNPKEPKNHLRMVLKILLRVSSSKEVKEVSERWRRMRGLTKDLPPPGGPIAVMRMVFMIFLKGFSLSLCSYHPPWSKYCLSNSIGGCAPYFYLVGMLRSSTNRMQCSWGFGPYYPLRILSSFPSMISCVCMEEVCAENPSSTDIYFSADSSLRM